MAATIIDSRIFGDIFSDARMRQVWSDENRTAKYLDIERALAKVQGELGLIPQEAALFLLLPYSKFVHGLYRALALLYYYREKRQPNPFASSGA